LPYFKRTNEIGPLDDKIVYIAKLFNERAAPDRAAESGVTRSPILAGKKVNFSDIGSGHAALHARHFREARHQAARSNMGQADAFER